MTDSSARDWTSLSPWEKAAQWAEVAPQIADQVQQIATRFAGHQMAMERERHEHEMRMDVRFFYVQLVAYILGTLNGLLYVLVAWRYADSGHFGPGAVVLGAGAGVTGGLLALGRVIDVRTRRGHVTTVEPLVAERTATGRKKVRRQHA